MENEIDLFLKKEFVITEKLFDIFPESEIDELVSNHVSKRNTRLWEFFKTKLCERIANTIVTEGDIDFQTLCNYQEDLRFRTGLLHAWEGLKNKERVEYEVADAIMKKGAY